VQHHQGRRLKFSRFTQHLVKRPPSTAEEQVVQRFTIPKNQRRKTVWEREYYLKAVDAWQQQLSGLL
jgi:hypothetical protein